MKSILILNALIWSAVILTAAWLYRDTPDFIYLLGALTVGFTLQNGYTYNYLKKIGNQKSDRS